VRERDFGRVDESREIGEEGGWSRDRVGDTHGPLY
jgi:hypothetical protein